MRARGIALILLLGFIMPSPGKSDGPKGSSPQQQKQPAKLGGGATRHTAQGEADLILLHGKIWTGEPSASREKTPAYAQALAMLQGRILAVGDDQQIRAYAGPGTQVVDLQGRLVVPGFIDSHVHFLDGGFQLLAIELKSVHSEEEFTRRITEKVKTLPPGRWLQGGDWDEEAWPSARLPTRWLIDSVTPDNPVLISRYDGHSALANSRALQMAGVTKETLDPPGGVIVRDPRTGEPTGVLKEAAQGLVARFVPRPSEAEMEEALRAALKEAARVGVTSVQNITVDSDSPNGSFTGEIRLLRRAEQEGWLTCRMYEIVPGRHWQKLAEAGVSHGFGSEFLKLGAVKAFADGSLGSRTAWMFEPFDDDPGNRGLPTDLLNPPAKMEALARGAEEAQIQLCVHAIGDRAISTMLDIYSRLGRGNPARLRLRIEHAQHVRPADFARFGKLGVIASMQPYHCIDDGRWAEKRIGHVRAGSSYAWRSMLEAGVSLAFGSDWPVAPLDPLLGIYAAVTRATPDGAHPGGWIPEQRLAVEEAVRGYTQGAAYAAFEEQEKGTIAPGKLADVVVLSDNLFSLPPEKIQDARVVLTILGGKVVYRKM